MNRSDTIAEAAITLLAERGMRGLTHRAVDEAAGLPPGATSNVARTRAALLELTLSRLTVLERQAFAGTLDAEGGDFADRIAATLVIQLNDRRRTLARYELALEATRRPELREIYDRAGGQFRDPAVAMLTALGSPDPVRHGRMIVAYGEGVMFDAIAGAGQTPSHAELREGVRDLLRGMLAQQTSR
ncbi:TetR/AcrR family transcriptional regulator [Nonomuraea sp. NBC_01738]|uniref:TetR/AcrR family transcriptional regulator n=1 Tax=Nonomuraea sp. NBC_01738 TaxID=2976003 RepID=UPI002E10E14B|nr:TetR/AcrR family transcriptional regulator [Nonomuraea sp. NBC_01738]